MKKSIIFIITVSLFCLGGSPLPAKGQGTRPEKDLLKSPTERGTYDPAGRRDPFKNLLAGKDIREKAATEGIPQLAIEEANLVGIIKAKQILTAIVVGPQGFPYFVKVGDKFSDGYILAINDYQVVFRKTNERGIPLMRPRDIIREINPEER